MSYTKYPKGSEWRKWDLHVHTPLTKINDCYNGDSDEDRWDCFCEKIEESDVRVLGITDYFSVENFFVFIEKFRAKYQDSKKVFFPNIELRLEVSVGRDAKEVNIHVIFSDSVQRQEIESFLLKLNTRQSNNGASVPCTNLSNQSDFESATVDYKDLRKVLEEVFGKNVCYLLVAASNDLRPERNGPPRKQITTDEIDKVCDAFFSCQ